MLYKRSKLAIIGCMAALLLAPLGLAQAQTTEPEENPPVVVSLFNKYIDFRLGVSGTLKIEGMEETFDVAGRYLVTSRTGDPEVTGDDNQFLVFTPIELWPVGTDGGYYALWKIKVGNANPIRIGGPGGTWTKLPRVYSPPTPGLGLGKTGSYIEGEWTSTADNAAGIGAVTVRVRISLVRDQVRFEFDLVNNGATTQSVGFAMLGDVAVEPTCSMGYPFIPGVGLARLAGFPDQVVGSVISGTKIPNYFDYYDSVDNPVVVTRNTLKGHDCVAPDYLAIGEWSDIQDVDVWLPEGYQPELENPRTPLNDVAWLLEWKQTALRARASRKIVTYYGVGAASAAWTHRLGTRVNQDSAMLAVQGPRALEYDSTVPVTTPDQTQLKPYSFTIKAYVYNMDTDPGPYDLKDVSVYLHLPRGLQLVTGSEAQQELGAVAINSEAAPVEWEVAATGEYSGELEYYVSARDVSGWQQIVSRKIMVPAVKKTVVRGGGYQMMSVPFTANNPSFEHLLGWASGSYFAKTFNPSGVGFYQTVTKVQPGQGFWVSLANTAAGSTIPVQLATDAMVAGEVETKQTGEVHVELGQGWNMIGNPFVYPVYLGQMMVYNRTTNTTITFDEACAQNWISRTVFGWNPDKQAYEYLKGNDSYLLPWKGYWMRARVPVTLVFRPAIWPAGGVTTQVGGY